MPVLKNPKHEAFAQGVAKGMPAGRAYEAAGYSAKGVTADQSASRLLSKDVNLQARVTELREAVVDKVIEETALDKAYVLSTIHQTVERCKQAQPVLDRRGEIVMVETPTGETAPAYVFDAKSVLKGAELIGKHLGMFKDKLELSGKDGGPIETKETGNGRELARRIAFALQRTAARPARAG